jgi:predicted permease
MCAIDGKTVVTFPAGYTFNRILRMGLLDIISQDAGFVIRSLVKRPWFTTVVVVTLALGIGVNTAIFSLVNGIVLQPLPYPNSEQLVKIWDRSIWQAGFASLRERSQTMDIATYSRDAGFNLSANGEAVRLVANGVSGNLFTILGVKPFLGRVFTMEEEAPGQMPVILSYDLWKTHFKSDPNVIEKSITLDERTFHIVGVMPPGFGYPSPATQVWAAIAINPNDKLNYWSYGYNMVGRIRPGNDLAKARAELKTLFPEVVSQYPFPQPKGYGADIDLLPLLQSKIEKIQPMLRVLLAAVFLILLVACVNVANLLLNRSANRQKEIAVRVALGASHRRIIGLLLTEGLFLGIAGGVLGSIVGFMSLRLLKNVMPADTPRLDEVMIDGHVLAFTAGLSIITGLIFGLAPLLRVRRMEIEHTLRDNSRGAGLSGSRSKTAAALVIAEISIAMALVSGAGLLIKSLWVFTRMNTGVQEEQQILIASITPSMVFYQRSNQCEDFYRQLLEGVRRLPGIRNASLVDTLPLENSFGVTLTAADLPDTVGNPFGSWEFTVRPGYFSTMGIPLLRGRDFTEFDRSDSPKVVVISKTVAASLWPGEEPLGKRVRPPSDKEWWTVIGVVEDVGHQGENKPFMLAKGDVYFPASQETLKRLYMDVVARRDGDLGTFGREVSTVIKSLGPDAPIARLQTMKQVVTKSFSRSRMIVFLFSVFAGLALLLGVVGIYSVVSNLVVQRTKEIGVRMALGADKFDILRMMLNEGLVLICAGLALGAAGAWALSNFLRNLLSAITPVDLSIYAIVALLIATAALLATYIPSRRAARIEPTSALRCE